MGTVPHMKSTVASPNQKVVTPTDGVAVTLKGPDGAEVPCRAFIPATTGNLSWIDLVGEPVTWSVTGGQQYNFSVRSFENSGSAVTSVLAIA